MKRKLFFSDKVCSCWVDIDSILVMQSDNSYTTIYFLKGDKLTSFVVSVSIAFYDKSLSSFGFFRVRQDLLVNCNQDIFLRSDEVGYMLQIGDFEVSISDLTKRKLVKLLKELIANKEA